MMDWDRKKYRGYYLPPALWEQIKKAVAQVGPMVFVKQMLTFRLTEVGAHGFCEADVDVSAYGSRGA